MKFNVTSEKYFIIFLYLSLIFLAIGLFRSDYVNIELERLNYFYLMLSFLFLFTGFLLNCVSWYITCLELNHRISLSEAISSQGLTVFGKYIPGKVWIIFGRAAYFAKLGFSLNTLIQLSLYTQLLSIWVGLGLGIVGLIFISSLVHYLWIIILLWAVCGILLFSPLHKIGCITKVMKKLSRNDEPFVWMKFSTAISKIPAFLLFWLSWTAGFFFLLEALFPRIRCSMLTSLAFPFAATLGIVALMCPGGLGVREGLLVLYLFHSGMSMENSTLASIASRIWFTIGEVFLFLVGIVLNMNHKNT